MKISGLKYQSNLNEIDKSEQKSQVDSSSKVFEWPPKDESHADSKFIAVNFIVIHFCEQYFLKALFRCAFIHRFLMTFFFALRALMWV